MRTQSILMLVPQSQIMLMESETVAESQLSTSIVTSFNASITRQHSTASKLQVDRGMARCMHDACYILSKASFIPPRDYVSQGNT